MARRPPEDFRVARQLHRSRAAPTAPRRPLQFVPAAQKVHCGPGWIGCSTAGPGQGPRCLSRPACVGRAHRRLDEGNPSLFVADSRFGQQDKRWSLHTAITIPYLSPLQCCDAAQSELWTATSDWSASGRSLVKWKNTWHGIYSTISCPGTAWVTECRSPLLSACPCPGYAPPHTSTDRGRTRPETDKTQTDQPKTCTRCEELQASRRETTRDRLCPSH